MLRVIQIRIPKTATSSIENSLKKMRHGKLIRFRQHGHAKTKQILQRYTPEQLKDVVILASVRHPCDRLLSGYQYIIQVKKDKREKELKYVFDFPSFQDFCMNLPSIFERNQFFHPHCRWLFDGEKKLYNFIIRYENLESDWEKFTRINNLKQIPLPIIRKTKHKPWRHYFNKPMMKVVRSVYKEDFRRLKYNGD